MTHAFTLALIYALALQAVHLVHAAAAGVAAERRVALDPWPLASAAVAVVIGVVLATDRLTAAADLAVVLRWAIAPGWAGAPGWLSGIGWLVAVIVLVLTLWLHEQRAAGRRWRAMAVNAPGLITAGLPFRAWPPALLGIVLAGLAGWLAPPPTATDWLGFACLALLATSAGSRPRGWAVRTVLLAWLVGGLIGGLETVLEPHRHQAAIAFGGLVAAALAAGRLDGRTSPRPRGHAAG